MTVWHFDILPIPETGARIGLCPCPGRGSSLADDLAGLQRWGARGVLTLVEDHELESLGMMSVREQLEALGIRWWHLPIRDRDVPDEAFEARWRTTGPELHALIGQGCAVALHCHGGLGRTGTIAARLLVELGSTPGEAIARVREVRPGSIETAGQEEYVHGLK